MYVALPWEGRALCVPLSQMKGPRIDEETQETMEDGHYWVTQGYEL